MKIKEVIKRHGFKQVEVAEALGVTKGSLNQTVHNENTSVNMLRKIAKIIGCDISEFFEDEATHQEAPVPGNSITCPNCGCEIEFRAKQ